MKGNACFCFRWRQKWRPRLRVPESQFTLCIFRTCSLFATGAILSVSRTFCHLLSGLHSPRYFPLRCRDSLPKSPEVVIIPRSRIIFAPSSKVLSHCRRVFSADFLADRSDAHSAIAASGFLAKALSSFFAIFLQVQSCLRRMRARLSLSAMLGRPRGPRILSGRVQHGNRPTSSCRELIPSADPGLGQGVPQILDPPSCGPLDQLMHP